ncbi:hypothetical protein [Aeromonas sp. ASNIH2]|uniref:hypothetical protein n=1 Tax=Aeromonas sp. ASNIH2 TaxID=1636607 RepID=UPI000CDC76C3|nr:hypothetical protein [Aeromonas sp. ASNIH2]AUY11170.1 hypothetical protein C3F36_17935 [Aeromonas sp. ASNIH2]
MEVQNLAGLGITQARQGAPTPPNFDGSNVNDQLGATLNQGGLLMRMAQSKGQGAASARGLGNSTIGIDAAQRAMVDAALPIAQQNAQQTHQRVMQGSDQQQQITMLDKQQGWQGNQNSLDRQQQLNMQSNQFGQDKNMANLNASLQKQRDDLLYQQQIGTLDKQGQLELKQLDAQLKNQTSLNNQQFGQQKELNQQQAFLQAERDGLLNRFQQGILDKEGQQRLKELDAQLKNQTSLNNQQNQWNSAEAQKERQQQLTVLEKQFGQETAKMAQQVVANTHGMYMGAIDSAVGSYNERYAAIMADGSMKEADKINSVNNLRGELNATFDMYQQLYSNISTIRPDWTKFPTIQVPGAELVVKK